MNTELSKFRRLTPPEKIYKFDVVIKKSKIVQENLNLDKTFKTSVNYGFIEFSKTNGNKVVDVKCSTNGYDFSELGKIFKFTLKEISLEIFIIENVLSNFSLLQP